MKRQKLLVATVIILAMFVIGTFLFINSSFAQVERSAVVLNDSFTVPANNYQIRGSIMIPAGESTYIFSFTVANGTVKFYPLDPGLYQWWFENSEELSIYIGSSWVEGDHADFGVSIWAENGYEVRCLFVNDDSYSKEVHLRVIKTWEDTNYLGMIGGIAIVVMGPVLGMTVKTKKLL
jgi:hypothetical protein